MASSTIVTMTTVTITSVSSSGPLNTTMGPTTLPSTSWGPGQFCQGLSPGGGDSCVTIPVGCYVVPSIGNVTPQVHCTASTSLSTPGSTNIPSTTPIIT